MLYIETTIGAGLAQVWRATRDPARHVRWDLRFTTIEGCGQGGHFRYATRLLPGLVVAGTGVTAGERHGAGGTATSALRFTTSHPLSLVRRGTGFWRYVPVPGGTRFLTGYDYRPGWGRAGTAADRVFRPFFGWATAWSFDRLRLWLERGIPPSRARNQALAELAIRTALVLAGLRIATAVPAGAALLVAVGVLAPPLPGTPAARRCRWGHRAAAGAVGRRGRPGGAARSPGRPGAARGGAR